MAFKTVLCSHSLKCQAADKKITNTSVQYLSQYLGILM